MKLERPDLARNKSELIQQQNPGTKCTEMYWGVQLYPIIMIRTSPRVKSYQVVWCCVKSYWQPVQHGQSRGLFWNWRLNVRSLIPSHALGISFVLLSASLCVCLTFALPHLFSILQYLAAMIHWTIRCHTCFFCMPVPRNEFKVRLADLEAYLLEKLAGAEGDILEVPWRLMHGSYSCTVGMNNSNQFYTFLECLALLPKCIVGHLLAVVAGVLSWQSGSISVKRVSKIIEPQRLAKSRIYYIYILQRAYMYIYIYTIKQYPDNV